MTFVIDIDGTLIKSKKEICEHCSRISYKHFEPILSEINLVNKFYNANHKIILWTGRGWDQYEITKIQLETCKIKYHELIMGKPQGIYVDKDNIKTLEEMLDIS